MPDFQIVKLEENDTLILLRCLYSSYCFMQHCLWSVEVFSLWFSPFWDSWCVCKHGIWGDTAECLSKIMNLFQRKEDFLGKGKVHVCHPIASGFCVCLIHLPIHRMWQKSRMAGVGRHLWRSSNLPARAQSRVKGTGLSVSCPVRFWISLAFLKKINTLFKDIYIIEMQSELTTAKLIPRALLHSEIIYCLP